MDCCVLIKPIKRYLGECWPLWRYHFGVFFNKPSSVEMISVLFGVNSLEMQMPSTGVCLALMNVCLDSASTLSTQAPPLQSALAVMLFFFFFHWSFYPEEHSYSVKLEEDRFVSFYAPLVLQLYLHKIRAKFGFDEKISDWWSWRTDFSTCRVKDPLYKI